LTAKRKKSNQRTEPLSEREALADVWMFCVAGMETTGKIKALVFFFLFTFFSCSAHTLGWLLLRLAFHQDVQSKLFAELSHMTEEQVADISAESAPYLFAAVHEALRLHPPVTLVPLEVRKGLDMPVGSLRRVEPKTRMEIHLEMIHLNGRHFENPEVFQPERFLKDGKFEHNPNIVAFNVGPRSCLGKSVAMLELAISAAVLVRSVKIEPVLSWERSSEWITKVTREFRKPTPFKLLLRK
jgi:cytochrome P450